MSTHYLNIAEFAARLGIKKDTLKNYQLPDPDITIGKVGRGWSMATIDKWDSERPRKRRVPRPDQGSEDA